MKKEITFEIIKNYGILSETKAGWKKEVNLVSWNDKEPKIEIRSWSPDKTKFSSGITLTEEELVKLLDILEDVEKNKETE